MIRCRGSMFACGRRARSSGRIEMSDAGMLTSGTYGLDALLDATAAERRYANAMTLVIESRSKFHQ